MKVMKFGGTSVGTPQRIKDVALLITGRGKNFVVLSAMAGTTNTLLEICDYIKKNHFNGARDIISGLESKYTGVIEELFEGNHHKIKDVKEEIKVYFNQIRALVKEDFGLNQEKEMASKGEIISVALMRNYLIEQGVNVKYVPALDIIKIDNDGEADLDYITSRLAQYIDKDYKPDLYLTEGFICLNHAGEIDNLQRGGSDLTASLIGAALKAEEIEIWTDIDGMHNNDPRYVQGTSPVGRLHFEEAAELAYFGAKILHPTCVLPAKLHNIPVRLLNTMNPEATGTLIYNFGPSRSIKAVAAKDNITAIKIKSGRMLLAYGFLRRVFEVFEAYKTPIDMIATSEVGVSVTIDSEKNLEPIVEELKQLGTVTVDKEMVIICVVGDMDWQNCGFESKTLDALRNLPVRMISYGGSNYNISFLVRKQDKMAALQSLSDKLFNNKI